MLGSDPVGMSRAKSTKPAVKPRRAKPTKLPVQSLAVRPVDAELVHATDVDRDRGKLNQDDDAAIERAEAQSLAENARMRRAQNAIEPHTVAWQRDQNGSYAVVLPKYPFIRISVWRVSQSRWEWSLVCGNEGIRNGGGATRGEAESDAVDAIGAIGVVLCEARDSLIADG